MLATEHKQGVNYDHKPYYLCVYNNGAMETTLDKYIEFKEYRYISEQLGHYITYKWHDDLWNICDNANVNFTERINPRFKFDLGVYVSGQKYGKMKKVVDMCSLEELSLSICGNY